VDIVDCDGVTCGDAGWGASMMTDLDRMREMLDRVILENWQLKGALGYPVPGHIPNGDFKCGLCEAKHIEIERLKVENERLRRHIGEPQ